MVRPNLAMLPFTADHPQVLWVCSVIALVVGLLLLWNWRYRRRADLDAKAALLSGEASEAFRTETLSPENPWPGLASFRQEDAAFFFGRSVETAELFRLIKSDTLTLLFSKSGLGKSSLINAGLFPLLKQKKFLPIYVRFDHSEGAASLSVQFQETVSAVSPRPRQPTLWEFFHQVSSGQESDEALVPVIVIDQFEEIFTLGRESIARRQRSAAFFHELADLILNNCPDSAQKRFEANRNAMRNYDFDRSAFRVVLSMREEYLAFLEEAHQPLRRLTQQRLRLTEMNGSQAYEAISMAGKKVLGQPSLAVCSPTMSPQEMADMVVGYRTAGRQVLDENVAADIVRYVAGSSHDPTAKAADLEMLEVSPALLSLVCSELNNQRRRFREPRITGTLVAGTRDQILADFYEGCFDGLNDALKIFVEDELLTSTGYRDAMALEDALQEEGVTMEGIQVLVNRRLLHFDRRAGTTRLEITHDILVTPCRAALDARIAFGKSWLGRLIWFAAFSDKAIMTLFSFMFLFLILEPPPPNAPLKQAASAAGIVFYILSVILPMRRINWVLRALMTCGIMYLYVSLLSIDQSNTTEAVKVALFLTALLGVPALLQGIYLASLFKKVFGIKRKLIKR